MARFRRSGFRRGSSKPVHPVAWCSPGEQETVAGSWPFVDEHVICTSDELELFTSPTIVRVRGDVWVSMEVSTAASFEAIAGVVYLIIKDDSMILQDMLLSSNADRPLMWSSYFYLHPSRNTYPVRNFDSNTVFTQTQYQNGPFSTVHIELDAKAMRRVPKDSYLSLAWSMRRDAGTPTASIRTFTRALIKE